MVALTDLPPIEQMIAFATRYKPLILDMFERYHPIELHNIYVAHPDKSNRYPYCAVDYICQEIRNNGEESSYWQILQDLEDQMKFDFARNIIKLRLRIENAQDSQDPNHPKIVPAEKILRINKMAQNLTCCHCDSPCSAETGFWMKVPHAQGFKIGADEKRYWYVFQCQCGYETSLAKLVPEKYNIRRERNARTEARHI